MAKKVPASSSLIRVTAARTFAAANGAHSLAAEIVKGIVHKTSEEEPYGVILLCIRGRRAIAW